MTDTEPHQRPACPWPGWELLYATMIRDVRAADPELVGEDFEPGSIHPNFITSSQSKTGADAVFDRIEEAEQLSVITCVICGGEGSGWPPLCAGHGG